MKRIFLSVSALLLLLMSSGCADIISIPSVAVSHDGQWVAFIAHEEFAARFALKAVNGSDGTMVDIGAEGHQQGAFAWNPNKLELAYFNLDENGVPSIRISDFATPTEGVDVFGAMAFPGSFWVNQMAYSPDGTKLAIVALLLPDGSLIDPNLPYSIHTTTTVLYIGNVADGTLEVISVQEVVPTTAVWSPDGQYLAYMAWADDNQDDVIDFRAQPYGAGNDRSRVFVYDVATEATLSIKDTAIHASPTWLDKTRLALVAAPTDNPVNNGIIVYDLLSETATPIVSGDNANTILAISAAPNGSQIAYVTIAQSADPTVVTIPTSLRVVNADGTNGRELYLASGIQGILDVPVWSHDGLSLYITTANPPSAKITAFAEFDETLQPQQLLAIEVANAENTRVIYEGTMTSSGLMQFNLVE